MMTKTSDFVHTLIPVPKYNHGDLVCYENNLGIISKNFFGEVKARFLNNDAPDQYYWEYVVSLRFIIRNGKQLDCHDEDFVLETDLQPWQPRNGEMTKRNAEITGRQ